MAEKIIDYYTLIKEAHKKLSLIIRFIHSATQYVEDITGNRFTAKAIAQINLLKPGDSVFIENIKCKAADNTIRPMNPLVFTMR